MNSEDIKNLYSGCINRSYDQFVDEIDKKSSLEPSAIFIVSSPRVGSTFLYQQIINKLGCCYISNFTNDFFASAPAFGMQLEKEARGEQHQVRYQSEYGKTGGLFETSEASAVFANWFGGEHPSETLSSQFHSQASEMHMFKSIKAFNSINNSTFVTKNPWNSFRISSLGRVLPNALFVWIRRSIDRAALSDLENRYKRGDPEKIWNSATTKDYIEIQGRPYWEQVVLQQASYSSAISTSLGKLARSRWMEVWYENLCDSPDTVARTIFDLASNRKFPVAWSPAKSLEKTEVSNNTALIKDYEKDFDKITKFIQSSDDLKSLLYRTNN